MGEEVLVIGGGPAGLAASIATAQRGLRVSVADPCFGPSGDAPIDKCCGEGLLPPGIEALQQLGLPLFLLQQHGCSLAGIRFHYGRNRATAQFHAGGPSALGIRRTSLHALLQARARELGVSFLPYSARLLTNEQEGCRVRTGDRERWVRWVVGADGVRSAVRAAAGLERGHFSSRRFAVRQHFALGGRRATPRFVEVHWARDAQAYVTPVGVGFVGIVVIAREKLTDMQAGLARFPALAELLDGATAGSRARGAVTFHRTLPAVQRGAVALVGDASGGVDAVTGDGLALAFRQALALGDALKHGDLQAYGRDHGSIQRTAQLMSRALLTMGAGPVATRVSMELLQKVPRLFPALLRLHTAG